MNPQNVRAAFCVVIPPEHSGAIQAVRSEHDRAYTRWPPHINLLFPFVNNVEDACARLAPVLADIEAFDVTLDGALGHFQQRKQVTAHLVPDEPAALSHVVNVAAASLGLSAAERPFRPHLTVGQFKNAAAYASIQPLPAVTFRCTEIAVLTRVNDEPFKLLRALKLGAGQLRD